MPNKLKQLKRQRIKASRSLKEKSRKEAWVKRKVLLSKLKGKRLVLKKSYKIKTPYGPAELKEGMISGNRYAIEWVKGIIDTKAERSGKHSLRINKMKKREKGTFNIKILSGLGISLGEMTMPIKMKDGLIQTYLKSGAVENYYLYIDGKEITDGKNYNPYYHIK